MKAFFAIIVSLLATSSAFACQTTSAKVAGLGSGSKVENGVCYVLLFVEESKPHPVCKLNLQPEQEIWIPTKLGVENCPQDETRINGVVTYVGGGKYLFNGSVE